MRIRVELGPNRLVCAVARTAAEQAKGLQGHSRLGPDDGMLFPFHPPRAVTFHMGSVNFPIDLLFLDASGRVRRVVHAAQPGTRTRWSEPVVGAVLEVPAGYCTTHKVGPGAMLRVAGARLGQHTYNLLRTLTEASADAEASVEADAAFRVVADPPPPLGPGYYAEEPLHDSDPVPPSADHPGPEARFRDHRLPDEQPNAMDQPNRNWEQGLGYSRPLSTDPVYPVRQGRVRTAEDAEVVDSEVGGPADVEVDWGELAPVMVEAGLRAGVPWKQLVLSSGQERAVVTPSVIGAWLHTLGLPEDQDDWVWEAATTREGMQAIGTAFMVGGFADSSDVVSYGEDTVLVMTRPIAAETRMEAWT